MTLFRNYQIQQRKAEMVGAEIRRRLIAEGIPVGEGVMHDSVMPKNAAQTDRVIEIFHEVNKEARDEAD